MRKKREICKEKGIVMGRKKKKKSRKRKGKRNDLTSNDIISGNGREGFRV